MEISEQIVTQLNAEHENCRVAAFRVVFRHHFKPLLHFALQLTQTPEVAEEIVQDAFLKLWQHRVFNDAAHLKAYLYLVVRNLSVNHIKRKKWAHGKAQIIDIDTAPEQATALHVNPASNVMEELTKEVACLSPVHQRIFQLTYTEGYNSQETGAILNVKPVTVRKRISEIRRYLRGFNRHLGAGQLIITIISVFR